MFGAAPTFDQGAMPQAGTTSGVSGGLVAIGTILRASVSPGVGWQLANGAAVSPTENPAYFPLALPDAANMLASVVAKSTGLTNNSQRGARIAVSDEGKIVLAQWYSGQYNKVSVSADGGANFNAKNASGLPQYVDYAAGGRGVHYVGSTHIGAIFSSQDDGSTWVAHNAATTTAQTAMQSATGTGSWNANLKGLVAAGNLVCALWQMISGDITGTAVSYSADRGATWFAINTALGRNPFNWYKAGPQGICIASYNGIRYVFHANGFNNVNSGGEDYGNVIGYPVDNMLTGNPQVGSVTSTTPVGNGGVNYSLTGGLIVNPAGEAIISVPGVGYVIKLGGGSQRPDQQTPKPIAGLFFGYGSSYVGMRHDQSYSVNPPTQTTYAIATTGGYLEGSGYGLYQAAYEQSYTAKTAIDVDTKPLKDGKFIFSATDANVLVITPGKCVPALTVPMGISEAYYIKTK